jgi:deoxyhypusine synthase
MTGPDSKESSENCGGNPGTGSAPKRQLHDGRKDGLHPLVPLDIRTPRNFAEMLDGMANTAFGGRSLGEAFHVLKAMASDPDCYIVLTVSGAMTVAKMGRVICEMIENNLAHCVVCTGALMAHGLSEAIGGVHYKHEQRHSDRELYEWGYNRVYDTLEMEANLNQAQNVMAEVHDAMDPSRPTSSHEINREIGRRLLESGQMPSILGCAFQKGVRVYIPAYTDSELGLDTIVHALNRVLKKNPKASLDEVFAGTPTFNPFLDVYSYARDIYRARRLGIVTIGGGVPRNWAQQVGPLFDVINEKLVMDLKTIRFQYGVRICPEPVHWGGLSGCTYSEGVSWGKFVSAAEGGRFAEVYCDATIAWPILIRAVLEARGVIPGPGAPGK